MFRDMPSPRVILRAVAAMTALVVVAGTASIAPADTATPAPTRIVAMRDVIDSSFAFAPDGTAYWLTDPYRDVRVVAMAPGGEPAIVGTLPPIGPATPPAHITTYALTAQDDQLAIRRTVTGCSEVDPTCLTENHRSASELIVGPPDALKVVAGCGPNTADPDCVTAASCPLVLSAVSGAGLVAAAVGSCHAPFSRRPATTVFPVTGPPVSVPATGYPRGIAGSQLLSAYEDDTDPTRPFTALTLHDWTTGQLLWQLDGDDASYGARMAPDGTVVFAGFSRSGSFGARLALIPPGQPPSSARTLSGMAYLSILFGFAHDRVLVSGASLHSARVVSAMTGASTPVRLAPHPTLVDFDGTRVAYRVAPCGDEWLVLQDVDGPPPGELLRTCPAPVPRSTLHVGSDTATLTVACRADPYLTCPGSADVRLYGRRGTRVVGGRPRYLVRPGEAATLTFRLNRADRRFIAAEHPRRARIRLNAAGVEGSKLRPLSPVTTVRVTR
jgi:hypothetical protein